MVLTKTSTPKSIVFTKACFPIPLVAALVNALIPPVAKPETPETANDQPLTSVKDVLKSFPSKK